MIDTDIYERAGCTLYRGTLEAHKGLGSWSFCARSLATIANEVLTNYKSRKGENIENVISELLPNVEREGLFVNSYDLRRAVRKTVTGRAA